MRISLRYKILGVLSFLLIAAVSSYTLLATFIFKDEKTALLYDLNHSVAVNTASQLRTTLQHSAEQLRLFMVSQILDETNEIRLPGSFLSEGNITGVRLFRDTAEERERQFTEMKLGPSIPTMTLERTQLTPQLREASTKGMAFWRSASGENQRLFLISRIEFRHRNVPEVYLAVGELAPEPLLRNIQESSVFTSYLISGNGEVLLHCNGLETLASTPIPDHPLLKIAAENEKGTAGRTGASSYEHRGEAYLGAFAPLNVGGLYFISQASKSEIDAAIRTLVQRSALFALIVFTVTFIASILFSKRLTRDLKRLTDAAGRIGKGDLDTKISVHSGDEIEELAVSFTTMLSTLRSSHETIEKYNRELESMVTERTNELTRSNVQIKEVQEKLLQTTQLAAVGEVAGRTAHEILNPLTAIVTRLDRTRDVLAQEENLPGQLNEIFGAWEEDYKQGGTARLAESLQCPSTIHPEISLFEEDLDNLKKIAHFWQHQNQLLTEDLQFVHEQSHRIHRIIDGMREMVRGSVKTDIHCHPALQDAISTLQDFVKKQGIKLVHEFSAPNDLAHLNRDELIQILTNLVRNAFQSINSQPNPLARKRGLIQVRTSGSPQLLLVDVIDNGPGIPAEKSGFIFDHGFTTKGPKEGTGLGLSISRRYARSFGGEVELLRSDPDNRGTCFRITIPLKAAEMKKAS